MESLDRRHFLTSKRHADGSREKCPYEVMQKLISGTKKSWPELDPRELETQNKTS